MTVARLATAVGLLIGLTVAPARAEPEQSCDVPAYLLSSESSLPRTAAARESGKLDILVIGTRSATLARPEQAFPARLEAMLREKLPAVQISVAVDVQPKRTTEEMAAGLGRTLATRKPTLVIWQTGTVDAMRSIDPDEFRSALDEGVSALTAAGTDVILMNLQYSPRTETMISPSSYIDNMRVVAQQHEVPLFDRFAMMRHWSESGDFDLFSPSPGVDLARRVHDCLARALTTFVMDAARSKPAETGTQR
jgi:hypothetical protein